MATYENDTLIRTQDADGNNHIHYPITLGTNVLVSDAIATALILAAEEDPSVNVALMALIDLWSTLIPISQIGVANGVAPLDENKKVLLANLPELPATLIIYDNSASGLSATTLQAALDELSKKANTDIEQRVSNLETFLYTDITTNQHSMTFSDLTGLEVTGVWNATMGRLEC